MARTTSAHLRRVWRDLICQEMNNVTSGILAVRPTYMISQNSRFWLHKVFFSGGYITFQTNRHICILTKPFLENEKNSHNWRKKSHRFLAKHRHAFKTVTRTFFLGASSTFASRLVRDSVLRITSLGNMGNKPQWGNNNERKVVNLYCVQDECVC